MLESQFPSPAGVSAHWDISKKWGLEGSPSMVQRGSGLEGSPTAVKRTGALKRTPGALLWLSGGLDERVVLNVVILN